MPQAKRLIAASLTGNIDAIKKAVRDVDYYMRRNFIAYISHRKKTLNKIKQPECTRLICQGSVISL